MNRIFWHNIYGVMTTNIISFEKKQPLQDPQTQVTRPAICKTTLVTDEDECVLDMFISNNHYFLNKPNFPIFNFKRIPNFKLCRYLIDYDIFPKKIKDVSITRKKFDGSGITPFYFPALMKWSLLVVPQIPLH